MHTSSVALLQNHARAIEPVLGKAVEIFYGRLFERHPALRAMFPDDMARQRGHLLAAVALVAKNIHRLDTLEEPLMELGARHAAFGTRPEHYPVVRDGLIEALREAQPESWSADVEAAWTTALNRVAELMLTGAARAANDAASRLSARRKPA
jgi:nitric oxide dioxygenase